MTQSFDTFPAYETLDSAWDGDDDIRDGYRRVVDDVLPAVRDTVSVR